MKFLEYLSEEVSMAEIKDFEKKWLSKLKPMGLTAFEFSSHMGKRDFRINRPENKPPITAKELDFVMNSFVNKIGSQLRKDIQAVASNTAKKTHPLGVKNKDKIPPNNIEYVIISKSTNIALAIALHQDKKQDGQMTNKGMKGTAVIVPMTILRKKGFKTKQGVEVVVERREITGEEKMKFKGYLKENLEALELDESIERNKLFALGRDVNYAMGNVGLRPKREDFKKAAKKLGLTIKMAQKAWNEYTWGG